MAFAVNPDPDAHELHAKREQVWAEALEWYASEIKSCPQQLMALYDILQKDATELREALSRMDDDALDIVSRLATAAMVEGASLALRCGNASAGTLAISEQKVCWQAFDHPPSQSLVP